MKNIAVFACTVALIRAMVLTISVYGGTTIEKWGFVGSRTGGWKLTQGESAGNISISGDSPNTSWSAIRSGFDCVAFALDSGNTTTALNLYDVRIELGNAPVSVAAANIKSPTYWLSQNYPNPFNPKNQINYSIHRHSYITLKVYNLIGQEVTTLFEGILQPGNYIETFDGKGLAGGVYLYCLRANNFMEIKKLILLK